MTLRAGFSLIEVVISLAILGIGVFGAMRVFPVGLRASQRAELISRASLTAQRTMESLKMVSWEDLTTQPTVDEDPLHITVAVDEPAIEGLVDASRLKRVLVTVSWAQARPGSGADGRAGDGKTRTLELVSYVRRPPT